MSKRPAWLSKDNVNVTLDATAAEQPPSKFPCPLCGAHLDLRESRAKKPYCICNPCGVQIFFRGKDGISRLRRLLDEHTRILGSVPAVATPAIAAFNRLEQLRAQKNELHERRPLIFTDEDLENTISAVDREIARMQAELARLSGDSKS